MVVEHFADPKAVYQRFAEKGRMLPDGLLYIDSWIDTDVQRCFQLMETEDEALFDDWISNWSDLGTFEIIPLIDTEVARKKILGA